MAPDKGFWSEGAPDPKVRRGLSRNLLDRCTNGDPYAGRRCTKGGPAGPCPVGRMCGLTARKSAMYSN